MLVSELVRREVRARFDAADAAALEHRLETTSLPFLEAENRARERDRVHLGILLASRGDPERFVRHLAMAAHDWRDVLMAAGLAHGNWPEVLAAAGFPVP